MPNTTNLKYTCINHLIQKASVDYNGKDPRNIYKKLSSLRQIGIEAKEQGNDENAYIYLKRWIDTVKWLKESQDYKNDKSIFLANMTTNQINQVKNILADLRQKLKIRYKQISKKTLQSDTVEHMEVETETMEVETEAMEVETEAMEVETQAIEMTEAYISSNDITLKFPETPTDNPLYADSDKFISCDQMYHLFKKKIDNRYLVIDIRQKNHYDNSKIVSDRCINIPQSEIKTGTFACDLLKYLHNNKHSHQLFKYRSARYVDVIILLDWYTTQESLTPNSHLNILKMIFEKWDPGVKHKKIKILNGGYTKWLIRYPSFTTNHNVTMPELNNVANEILDTIKHLELLNSDDEDLLFLKKARNKQKTSNKDVELEHSDNKSSFKHAKSNNSNIIPSMKSTNHAIISINGERRCHVDNRNVQHQNSDTLLRQKISSSKVPQNETNIKSIIDHSNKPVSLKTDDLCCKEVLTFMNNLCKLAKSKEKLVQELLDHERLLYLPDDKCGDATDEKYLCTKIKSLKDKIDDMHQVYLKIKDEYNKIADSIKFDLIDDKKRKDLKRNFFNTQINIKKIEDERIQIQDFLKKKHKEMRQNDNDIHKQPLETDGSFINTGLERSYSSPNLSQLGEHKSPQVHRISKPHVLTRKQNGSIGSENIKRSPLNWGNREERMAPIHGSVHPGITGLKNLGNSCYMNSIIQCLSNTTHLAKYLTDNSYADDLNNDNMTQGQVVEEVAQIIKALWRGQYKSISPCDLKDAVGQYKLQFGSSEQQDSHEFLTFLLDWMHDDLKKKSKVPIEMSNAEKEWDKAMNFQRSIISDLFFGQLRSTITCSFCKQASITYETFNSLTMSLSHFNQCALNDCMEKFVTEQEVIGWKCPKCKTLRDATKKFDFVKLAPIVIIHLNRFAERGGWLEKRNTAVDFPLTGFNLSPYLVIENAAVNYNYTLYAMSNHYGTMDGGHYTAFCKNAPQNKWYKYDDQSVTEVLSSQVESQNTKAYLLFYTSLPNSIM